MSLSLFKRALKRRECIIVTRLLQTSGSSLASTSTSKEDPSNQESAKPDDKDVKKMMRNSRDNTKRNIVIGACILAFLYMYPTIFRPMFGIESTKEAREKREAALKKVAATRPGNMPEWSSPFDPKDTRKKS